MGSRADGPHDRPHTVEEAYEVADAAVAGDQAELEGELGDLLFQVFFLSLLLKEEGRGDLESVTRHVHEKLVRRHPHVFGDGSASDAGAVRLRWEEIKTQQEGRDGSSTMCPSRSRGCSKRERCSVEPPPSATTGAISQGPFAKLSEELDDRARRATRSPLRGRRTRSRLEGRVVVAGELVDHVGELARHAEAVREAVGT